MRKPPDPVTKEPDPVPHRIRLLRRRIRAIQGHLLWCSAAGSVDGGDGSGGYIAGSGSSVAGIRLLQEYGLSNTTWIGRLSADLR